MRDKPRFESRSVRWLALAAMLGIVFGSQLPAATNAQPSWRPSAIAQVRYILHGLAVQPPHQRAAKGTLKQSLYAAYLVQTSIKQKASLGFRDGTLLHLNERTDAVLKSPSITQVTHGEVEQLVAPGTSHQVKTAAAVASAIGTQFDVAYLSGVMTITVIEGAVLVSNASGFVVVKSGQQATVTKGQAPSIPTGMDPTPVVKWATPIPGPKNPLGLNIALDANGGNAYGASSTRASSRGEWSAAYLDDGRLDRGWQSAQGQVANQSVSVRFQGLHPYTIIGVFLDCAATGGEAANNALKDFSILGSSDGSGFTDLLDGRCGAQDGIQLFALKAPAQASTVQVAAKSNQGGSDGIAIAEVGVISTQTPAVLGTPTPIPDTATPIPPTSTSTSAPAPPTNTPLSPTPTDMPAPETPTAIPLYQFAFSGLSFSWTFAYSFMPQSYPPAPIAGTACGTDPIGATWNGTTGLGTGPTAWHFNFSTLNPHKVNIINGTEKNGNQTETGRVTASLQVVPGPSPLMVLMVVATGVARVAPLNPSSVPIQVQQVASCP